MSRTVLQESNLLLNELKTNVDFSHAGWLDEIEVVHFDTDFADFGSK
jgi:hypothetical protein